MAYFKDLTPYHYGGRTKEPEAGTANVGWLSKDEPFEQGDVSPGFAEKVAAWPVVNLYRGWHSCPFCQAVDLTRIERWRSGNGEIRVPGLDGVVYVAPQLVAHYIAAHQYLPPQGFIDAVIATPTDAEP